MAGLITNRTKPNPKLQLELKLGLSFAIFLREQLALNKSLLGLSLINRKFD